MASFGLSISNANRLPIKRSSKAPQTPFLVLSARVTARCAIITPLKYICDPMDTKVNNREACDKDEYAEQVGKSSIFRHHPI